jgi:hypothetical protein
LRPAWAKSETLVTCEKRPGGVIQVVEHPPTPVLFKKRKKKKKKKEREMRKEN